MGIEITINGRRHVVGGSAISYEQVVQLAGEQGTPSMTQYWRGGHAKGREGRILSPGQSVPLDDGLVFCAVHTGNA